MTPTTATHPDQLALLRTVLERPDEDSPRLVAADWLEENDREEECGCGGRRWSARSTAAACVRFSTQGGSIDIGGMTPWGSPISDKCPRCSGTGRVSNGFRERAEFIRVQVEIARLNPGPKEARKAANMLSRYRTGAPIPLKAKTPAVLLVREALLRECDSFPSWAWGNVSWEQVAPAMCPEWSRGFVASISLPTAAFMEHAAELFACQPIERVTLVGCDPGGDRYEPCWFRAPQHYLPDPEDVPASIWDYLLGGEIDSLDPNWRTYATKQDALEDLSAACVSWGRSQVDTTHEVVCPHCSGEGCAQHGHGDPSERCNGSGRLVRRGLPALERA